MSVGEEVRPGLLAKQRDLSRHYLFLLMRLVHVQLLGHQLLLRGVQLTLELTELLLLVAMRAGRTFQVSVELCQLFLADGQLFTQYPHLSLQLAQLLIIPLQFFLALQVMLLAKVLQRFMCLIVCSLELGHRRR